MSHPTVAALDTVGLDVGDRFSHVCVLAPSGRRREEGRCRTTPEGLQARFGGVPRSRIVLEAGTHSPWVSRLLGRLGHDVVVANPRRLQLISQSDAKTDRADAELLARLGRTDAVLLRPIRHRGEQTQADLARLRAREVLVSVRTALINHMRGAVKSFGARLPRCGTKAFVRKVPQAVPELLRPALQPVLDVLEQIDETLSAVRAELRHVADTRYPQTRVLRQVPGVGPITSLAFVLTLEDPRRFSSSRAVGAYLGLRPRKRESGERSPELSITKAGDTYLRKLLVEAAHVHLRHVKKETALQRWGLALASRGCRNAKKRALVAVARKLAVLLHRLWVTGEVYDPDRGLPASPSL